MVSFNCNAAVGKELSIVAVVAKVWRGTMVLDASKKANTIILLQVGVKAILWAVQLAKARNLEKNYRKRFPCYQSPKVEVPSSVPSSAAGASAATLVQPRLQHSAADSAPRQHQHVASASAATLMQLRLQHSAADSAPGQHQCVSDQARHFDDVTADAKATSIKIEEFQELYRHTRQNRDVA